MSLKEFDAGSGRPADAVASDNGERIRVDQVSLYTDPTQNNVQRISLQQLLESPFNPRKNFNQAALEKMAATVRAHGVMQPILVRPVAMPEGWAITNGSESAQPYEIVYGHRRYRASKIAEVDNIPCIVRELSDSQTKQLQAIENVQREDLNPIEAARSYQQYLQAHDVSKDQLAEEIGLSRSHVYSYLKLLDAVPVIQEAVEKGEIGPDVAVKIARLHTPKLQERALTAIKGKYYDLEDGGKKSVRQITEFLAEKFTLKLSEAIFDTKDTQLLPNADACTTCPKRTGNAPEYEDLVENRKNAWRQSVRGEPNLCTDPDCFEAKKKAHLANEAAALEAKGKTVIAGNKARHVVGAAGDLKQGYIPLKDAKALLKKAGKDKAVAVAAVTIQNPRDGKKIEAVKVEDLKAAGVKVKEPAKGAGGGRYDYEAERRKRDEEDARKRAKAEEDTRTNFAVLAAVRRAAAGQPLSTLALQLVVEAAVRGVEYEQRSVLARLHDCKSVEALQKKVGQMPPDRLTTLLLDCALVQAVKVNPWRPEKPEALLAAAKHYGVDVAEIRKEVAARPADTRTEDLLKPVSEGTETPGPADAASAASPQEPNPAAEAWDKTFPKAAKGSRKKKSVGADAPKDDEASAAATALANLVGWPPIHQMLVDAGVTTREQLADLAVDELVAITGQDHETAGELILKAREMASEGAAT